LGAGNRARGRQAASPLARRPRRLPRQARACPGRAVGKLGHPRRRSRGGGRPVIVLVAGGAGFIGSAYVRLRLDRHPGDSVRVLDKLTYAGRWENLDGVDRDSVDLIEGDIADRDAVAAALDGVDAIVNFAAESHVDRSIES